MTEPGLLTVPGGVAGFEAAIAESYFPYQIEDTEQPDEFYGASAAGRMGSLLMSRTYVNAPFCGRRLQVSRGAERRAFVLMLLEDGVSVMFRGKRAAMARFNNLVLVDSTGELETEQKSSGTSLAVSIPAQLLLSRFPDVRDWCLHPLDTSEGSAAILRECLVAYWRSRPHVGAAEASDLVASLVHLVGAAFRNCSPLPDLESHAMRLHYLRLRDVVLQNLESSDLSADFAASRLGVSKSYLFAIMNAANTTFGRFVLEQRLMRSRERLADPTLRHLSITEVAFSTGFQELSHFSRSFTGRFGMSPRAFRAKLS